MTCTLCFVAVGLLGAPAAFAQPVSLHPANPHYFLFRGQPTILITSAEIYGAVLNLDFDYRKYLDALAAGGANYTRVYTGSYFEPQHKWFKNHSLGPADGRHCLPWGRSSTPGYVNGGNLFDLDTWNPEFFRRFKDYVRYAGRKGIVVEVALYNAQKNWTWPFHPLHLPNNVNGVGKVGFEDFQAIQEPKLFEYQKAYVAKITREVNEFDNVILEIIDEPTIRSGVATVGTSGERATAWIAAMMDTVRSAEAGLPKKHLIAQQVEGGGKYGPVDFSGDPRLSVIVGQYIWQNGNQVGALKLLDQKYGLNKTVELNETSVYPLWYPQGDRLAHSRAEAWEFIVGGGGGFNQLNSLYSTGNEDAAGTGNDAILRQLRLLRDFMHSFEFLRMRRDPELIAGGVPAGAFARGISEPGRQYALYIHHSRNAKNNDSLFLCYETVPGSYREDLELRIAAGKYLVEWVSPATGKVLESLNISHAGGNRRFSTPRYEVDLALRVRRQVPVK
jgi:hypothetical protein